MNDCIQPLLKGMSLLILFEGLRTEILRRFTERFKSGLQVRPLESNGTRAAVRVVRLLAGFGLMWGLDVSMNPGAAAAAGLLGLIFLIEWLTGCAGWDGFAGNIAFFEILQKEVEQGADFFAGLAAASGSLTNLRACEAVRQTLASFSARQGLQACLQPLAGLGGIFSNLAADVQHAGWEHSAALRLSVIQSARGAAEHWEKRRRLRVIRRIAEGRRTFAHQFGWGAAVGILVFGGMEWATLWDWLPAITAAVFLSGAHLLRHPVRIFLAAGLLFGGAWFFGLQTSVLSAAGVTPQETPVPVLFRDRNLRLEMSRLLVRAEHADVSCRVATGFVPGWARLREHPAMTAQTMHFAAEGAKLAVLDNQNGGDPSGAWRLVREPSGQTGWIFSDLCPIAADGPD